MFKSPDYGYMQLSFLSFNDSCGLQLDPNNKFVRIALRLPWRSWEAMYAARFPCWLKIKEEVSTEYNVYRPKSEVIDLVKARRMEAMRPLAATGTDGVEISLTAVRKRYT